MALVVTRKGELATDPEVELIGIPDKTAEGEPLADIAFEAVIEYLRIPAAGAPQRPRRRGRIRPWRGALGDRRALGQEAHVLRARAAGMIEAHAGTDGMEEAT